MPRTPVRRGTPQLRQDIAVAQGTAMMQRRLLGQSLKEIAEDFRTTPATVRARLELAREAGVLQQAQLLLLEKLLPLAVGAYAHALVDEGGDPELRLKAAKDIIFGTKALESKTTLVHEAPHATTLEGYRQERIRKALPGEVTVVDTPAPTNGDPPEPC